MTKRPRILLITGPGKGKTTAAVGMIVRCLAHGKRVLLTRFAKTSAEGEVSFLAGSPGFAVKSSRCGMTPPAGDPDFPRHVAEARRLFAETREEAERYDVVVLDEICGMVARDMIPEADVTAFLAGLRNDRIAVLTGRGAGPGLLAVADTASEILSLKHGYDRGVAAQEGVEC